jgi:hypothetical protein
MAVATDNQQLRAELFVKPYDFDPNGTSATDVGWIDAQDIDSLLVQFIRTVGSSDLTFTIIGNTAADGTGTDSAIKTITLSAQPDAALDTVFGEVTRGEIMQAAADAGREIRGVSAALTFATGTDEAIVNYIVKKTHVTKDNTADIVA